MTTLEVLIWCFRHFYNLDQANACIHTALPRYSPITFRLAETLGQGIIGEADTVLADKGRYDEDKGR